MTTHHIHLDETGSTNRYLLEHYRSADTGDDIRTADTVIVSTGYQTSGRGQGINRWESRRGQNLLCSIMVHPQGVEATQQFILSMAGALALYDILAPNTEGIALKWPNDVYHHDSKLSGTLIETTLNGKYIDACIFGIGLNVNQKEFTANAPNATSLIHILGQTTSVNQWLGQLTESLRRRICQVNSGAYADIRRQYHAALYRREGIHPYSDSKGTFQAETIGVEDDGHLLLRDTEGNTRRYAFKEVTHIISP